MSVGRCHPEARRARRAVRAPFVTCFVTRFVTPFVALLVLAPYLQAEAHDARPLSVEIVEETGYVYRVRIRVPPTVQFSNRPTIAWPEGCVPGEDRAGLPIGFSSSGGVMMCAGSLEGQTISFHYPQFNPSLSTVVRFTPLDGAVRMAVLTPAVSEWTRAEQAVSGAGGDGLHRSGHRAYPRWPGSPPVCCRPSDARRVCPAHLLGRNRLHAGPLGHPVTLRPLDCSSCP